MKKIINLVRYRINDRIKCLKQSYYQRSTANQKKKSNRLDKVNLKLQKYVYYAKCSGCGLFRSRASYPPDHMGADSDDSIDIITMGLHVDCFDGIDNARSGSLRIHCL